MLIMFILVNVRIISRLKIFVFCKILNMHFAESFIKEIKAIVKLFFILLLSDSRYWQNISNLYIFWLILIFLTSLIFLSFMHTEIAITLGIFLFEHDRIKHCGAVLYNIVAVVLPVYFV